MTKAKELVNTINANVARGVVMCETPWNTTERIVAAHLYRDGVWVDFADDTSSKIATVKGDHFPGFFIALSSI